MVAGRSDCLLPRGFYISAEHEAAVTGGNTGLTGSALIELNLKGVLLSFRRFGERDEVFVSICSDFTTVDLIRNLYDRGIQLLLISEKLINQGHDGSVGVMPAFV